MRAIVFAILLAMSAYAPASEFPFTLHKLKSGQPGPTLLVIGGIQGAERANKFRVEFYRQNKYSGMILIDFSLESRPGSQTRKRLAAG